MGAMRRTAEGVLLGALLAACAGTAGQGEPDASSPAEPTWERGPDLPRPVANNAVVGLDLGEESHVYSFLGIDTTKRWDGVGSGAYRWVVGEEEWEELPEVPGPGRLAGTAEAFEGKVYVFGGYTVAADGSEASLPNVDVFDPATDSWASAAPMPVPVDDAVSGVWRDSLIVLVSGWHDTDNVADVQLYDPRADTWSAATPIPGAPVFGHAGKVSGDLIVYLGGANTRGARPRYLIEPTAWVGTVGSDPGQVAWSSLETQPGPPLYRAASAAIGPWVVFAGGTDNPYNYNGVGYDGRPAQALPGVFAFHGPSATWIQGPALPEARMDHRALAVTQGSVVLVGGMDGRQNVTPTVWWIARSSLVDALEAELATGGESGR